VGNTATRPKLANKDAECELANLQEKRTPLYEQLSTITIDTTHHSPQEIAEQIVSKVNAL
jgi:shikimate kinase